MLALLMLTFAPAAANAHGGAFELTVSQDGAGGFAVIGVYEEDGHIVEEIIDPVATASSSDGRTVGPIALISAPEGVGRWITEEPVLETGTWTVTVKTTTPAAASVTAEFEVTELDPPIVPETEALASDEPADAATAVDASEAASAPAAPMWWPYALGAAVIVAAGGALLLHRRSLSHSSRGRASD